MKHVRSFIACCLVGLTLVAYRATYPGICSDKPLNITQWDAFGYYAYLPGLFIYHDIKKLSWVDEMDRRYLVTGGSGIPASRLDNGNYVIKYLGGVSIAEAPFFFIGHIIALSSGYPADGFSPPYQYSLAFGVILYCILALFLLRKILLLYFDDPTVALTLLLLCLATNFIQYAAIHNGLSHAWIFPLYVLVLYTTLRWHERPRLGWAALTGFIIGLATISRPTEAIMLLIPLLWQTQDRESARRKWRLVKVHRSHVWTAAIAGMAGVLPQLLYWKITSGSFVYDVGSKWMFFDPNFRVLFGWEKGWFIYTPVTILFIVGLWFIRRYPFRHSVLWFCLLNIWIVMAWEDWHYGASYSTRALVQSYPVFALPFAAVVQRINRQRWRPAFYLLGLYFVFVNGFQIWQYGTTVLHYDENNRRYYSRIYLNPNPAPLDMSLLDTDDWISDESRYRKEALARTGQPLPVHVPARDTITVLEATIPPGSGRTSWLRIDAEIRTTGSLYDAWLVAGLSKEQERRTSRIRLFNPVGERTHRYAFYMQVPGYFRNGRLRLTIGCGHDFDGTVAQLLVTRLER